MAMKGKKLFRPDNVSIILQGLFAARGMVDSGSQIGWEDLYALGK